MSELRRLEAALPFQISEEGRRILEQREAHRVADEAARAIRRREGRLQRMCACIPPRYEQAVIGSSELGARVKSPQAIAATERAISAPGVVWTGLSGSGKSTLACAALRARAAVEVTMDLPWSYMFVRAAELAVASKHTKLGEGIAELVSRASTADLLILDELGSEPRSAHWTDVEDVVFARYERNLPTWYTTWTDAEDIAKRYGDGFARRVFERAIVIECGGST